MAKTDETQGHSERDREPMPRPMQRSPEILLEAATRIAQDCAGWRQRGDPDEWVGPLIRASGDWYNGYDLAKALERDMRIDPDAELVEILDGAGDVLSTVHEDTVRKWVRIVGFAPAFAVGDLVATPHGTGPVHSIQTDLARYVVDIERRGNGGHIVEAERVSAADAPVA